MAVWDIERKVSDIDSLDGAFFIYERLMMPMICNVVIHPCEAFVKYKDSLVPLYNM